MDRDKLIAFSFQLLTECYHYHYYYDIIVL